MSSSDRARVRSAGYFGRAVVIGVLAALVTAAGCTVRPMYGDMSPGSSQSATSAALASVEIKPATTRVGQELRNQLIFLLAGGAGQPSRPAYTLTLATTAIASSATAVSTSRVNLEPTSGVMTVRTNYRLIETATGKEISRGVRSMQAPYDIPSQEFAALRAVRDAENRAARELAELMRLVVAQELEKPTSRSVPAIVSSPEEIEDSARAEGTVGARSR
ncbi:LPS assembly lipoprotein LptE [Mesorhizobium sp. CAU 1732]|uniref:LPS assembly lipoprotein LptE n=1 Tax=Mesorhizobium sp. CAU 1732 TaxID=3140358 RepID=UPI0032615871